VLQLKDLRRDWSLNVEKPLPPLFSQSIETTGVRGWGSAKRLKGKGLQS